MMCYNLLAHGIYWGYNQLILGTSKPPLLQLLKNSKRPVPLELLNAVGARFAKLAKSVLPEHLLRSTVEGWFFG